jgi:hypothetical protein
MERGYDFEESQSSKYNQVKYILFFRYFTSFLEEDNLYIIMEFADGGDLYSVSYINLVD